MRQRRVLIRADAGYQMGSGHVVRMLTLARELASRSVTVEFCCRSQPGDLISKIQESGFSVRALRSNDTQEIQSEPGTAEWFEKHWLIDLQSMLELLPYDFDGLILDHYFLPYEWEQLARERFPWLMVVDDFPVRRHNCDLFLDQNVALPGRSYQGLLPEHCVRLLGPEYLLLDPRFRQRYPGETRSQIAVLVFLGGMDSAGYTRVLMNTLSALPELKVKVVVGVRNPEREAIERIAGRVNADYFCDHSNMAKLISSVDCGIIAAGFVSYEFAAMKKPALYIPVSGIQQEVSSRLEELGLGIVLDRARITEAEYLKSLLMECIGLRIHNLGDGCLNGVVRVADKIMDLN